MTHLLGPGPRAATRAAALVALLAGAAGATPPAADALAAAWLCQTSYRLDDELAADEAAGGRGYPRARARLEALLQETFGRERIGAVEIFRAPRLDLLAIGIETPDLAAVAFRGSRGPREPTPGGVSNWALNRVAAPATDVPGYAPRAVHGGYVQAARALYPQVASWLQARQAPQVWLTGHSLGAAVASYVAFRWLERPGRAPGTLLTFGAPAVAYDGCTEGPGLAGAFRIRAGVTGWHAWTYAFEDDAAPWLLRAVCPGASRLGTPVDLGPSPTGRSPVDPGAIEPGDPRRSAGARLGAAAARWMHLDTHYAFHYTRALARRWAEAEGHAFDAAAYRDLYGLPRPLPLSPD